MLLLFDVALFECEVCRPGSLLSHNAATMIPIALFCLNAFFIASVECQSHDTPDTGTRATFMGFLLPLVSRVLTFSSTVYLVFAHFIVIIADINPWQC